MERLYFTCPKSGERIDVGIESELTTLLQIRAEHVRAHCPHCGEWHEWPIGEAYLPPAA